MHEMEQSLLRIFMEVRERFPEVKEKVSLLKPYVELMVLSPALALKIAEFEKILGFRPSTLYRSGNEVYAVSVLYKVDDDLTRGIIAHQFAEIIARERDIFDHEIIDEICCERGFGEGLLYAFINDVFPGMADREYIYGDHLENRIRKLKNLLGR